MKRPREDDERPGYHDSHHDSQHANYNAQRRRGPGGLGESGQPEGETLRQTYSNGHPNVDRVVDGVAREGDFPPQYQNMGPGYHDYLERQPPSSGQREPLISSSAGFYRQQEHPHAREHPSIWSAQDQRDFYAQITPRSVGYHSSPQPPRSDDSGWGTPREALQHRNMRPHVSPHQYQGQNSNWHDQRQPTQQAGYAEHPTVRGTVPGRPFMANGSQPNTPHSIVIPSEAYPPGRDSGVCSGGQHSARRSAPQSEGTPRYFAQPAPPPFAPRDRDVHGAYDDSLERPFSHHTAHHVHGLLNSEAWHGDSATGNVGTASTHTLKHRPSYGAANAVSERFESAQYAVLPSPCTATRWSAVPPAAASEPAKEHERIAVDRLQTDLQDLWASNVEQANSESWDQAQEDDKEGGKQRAELRKRLLTNLRARAKASLVFESLSHFVEACHRDDFMVAIAKRDDGPSVGEPIALELTRQKYHHDIGFYAVVRVTVGRDLSFSVWIMQRQLWSGRLRSAWDFNVLLLRLSSKSDCSPCAGIDIRDLENAQSIASRSRVLRINSYPFLVGRHQECELWIPKERSSCVRCQQLKHQVAYSARKEARSNEAAGGAPQASEKPAVVLGENESSAGGEAQADEQEQARGGAPQEGEGDGGDVHESGSKATRESSFSPSGAVGAPVRKEGNLSPPEGRKASVQSQTQISANPSPLMLPTSEWKDYYTGRKQSIPGQSSCESLTL